MKNARDSFDHLLRNRRLNTIIIVGNISATFAGAFVVLLNYFVDHFRKSDLKDLIVRSAEPVLLGKMCSSS